MKVLIERRVCMCLCAGNVSLICQTKIAASSGDIFPARWPCLRKIITEKYHTFIYSVLYGNYQSNVVKLTRNKRCRELYLFIFK